jgi:type IV secretory pathway VirB2 component (pilin)
MAEKKEQRNISKTPFTNVLEILANKVSRKAAVVGLAMVLIYLLAATPNIAQALIFIIAIAGLAIFFTTLQWVIDLKSDGKKTRKKKGGYIGDEGKDDK